MDKSLARIARNWTAWGDKDPLFAVLSDDHHKGNLWDVDEFFATGRHEIDEVLEELQVLGVTPPKGSALDFGCGVGRLTQALGDHFESCVGVDIAPSMIERATGFNRHGGRCEYVVNASPDLSMFADETFDFVYSNIVLQHMPSDLSTGYMREFVRVLRPSGVAVFTCPSRPRAVPGTKEQVRRAAKESLRLVANAVGRIVSTTPFPRMDMHCVPQENVEDLLRRSGAALVEARVIPWGEPIWVTVKYTAQAPARATPA